MSQKASPAAVGSFVLGAIAVLVAAVTILGSGAFFRETQPAVIYFPTSVNGLGVGAPVKFKGVEIGTVREIHISIYALVETAGEPKIPVVIALDKKRLTGAGIKAIEFDPAWVRNAVERGLRAELASESLVTGVRYVALDLKPGTPAALVADPTVEYPEIPSLPTFTEQLPAELTDLVEKLAKVDYEHLVDSVSSLAEDTRKVVGSPELKQAISQLDDIARDLRETSKQARRVTTSLAPDGAIGKNVARASENAERLINPDGALSTQLDATLRELRAAASSLRQLSDQLKRDPGSLLRGAEQ
jgi:paraquat-inducible protein B